METGGRGACSLFTLVCANMYLYPVLVLLTVFFVLVSPLYFLVGYWVTPYSQRILLRYGVWLYGRCWMFLFSPFVQFKVSGFEEGNMPSPCVMVSNHRSFFDTFCMGALPVFNVVFTARAWPFKIPCYGIFMRLGRYINLEDKRIEEILDQAKMALDEGVALHFFPEGHRGKGGSMHRFRSGAFRVAYEAGVPIKPVCLKGLEVLLPAKCFLFHPATIEIHGLSPLLPQDYPGEDGYLALRKHTTHLMRDFLQ